MALQARLIGEVNNGEVDVYLVFDDTDGSLETVLVRNDGDRGTITLTLREHTDDGSQGALLFTGTRQARQGTRTYNVPGNAPYDFVWMPHPKTGVMGWYFPYDVELAWG